MVENILFGKVIKVLGASQPLGIKKKSSLPASKCVPETEISWNSLFSKGNQEGLRKSLILMVVLSI